MPTPLSALVSARFALEEWVAAYEPPEVTPVPDLHAIYTPYMRELTERVEDPLRRAELMRALDTRGILAWRDALTPEERAAALPALQEMMRQ